MSSRVVAVFGQDADEVLRSPQTLVVFYASVLMLMNADMLSPLLPIIMDEYAVSETQIGLVMTALTLPTVLFIPIMGAAADRFARRHVLGGSLLVTGLAGLGIVLTDSFDQLLALRVVQGIGYSGVQPITVTLLGDLYDGPTEATAQGIRTFINSIGGSIFPLVGGALLVVSWKAPFVLYVLHLLAAVLAVYTISRIAERSTSVAGRSYVRLIASMLARKRILMLFFAGFTIYFLRYGIVTYLPLLLVREFGVTSSNTGFFVGLSTACAGVGASQAGRFSRRFTHTRTLQAGLLIAGSLLVVLPFIGVTSTAVSAGVIVCYGVAWGVTTPVQKSLLNQLVTAKIRAGTISASYMATNLGKSAAPIGIGVAIAASNYRVGFALLGLLPIVTALVFVGFADPSDEAS